MKAQDIVFPQYRKYKNGLSYFKIINALEMEEILIIGSKRKLRTLKAIQFPEKNLINDLLFHYEKMCNEIDEKEFEELRQQIDAD